MRVHPDKLIFCLIIAFCLGGYFPARTAQADGGLIDSAHRMAVALEKIAETLSSQAVRR